MVSSEYKPIKNLQGVFHLNLAIDSQTTDLKPSFIAAVSSLAPRERQVYVGHLQGHRTSEIAEMLGLSVKTASTYNTRICRKFSDCVGAPILHDRQLTVGTAIVFHDALDAVQAADIRRRISRDTLLMALEGQPLNNTPAGTEERRLAAG